ncbi:hypothetical protein ABOD71_002321 [Salmonella enterica subsp. enterica serovar Kiambu]|uniref:Uncharacterized protein n=1 Tax=Salmonella newport TaxID=108619 RepID=A0A752CKT5_SALNE|nr:hypothetical protein [Salmonella enterica]EKQ9811908.1 hypothetical protein [Salmonella enterica subsp. enterica serovar Newport]EGW7195852.1 hypothetical protein [Salmonella enterica]EIA8953187.1 hypothetical protein [Salmonella enterica]EIW2890289.1 hypothetical protein [Salmonella enterica]
MMNNDTRQKLIRFLVPGRLGTGFLLGAGFMLWLAVERKPEFDEFILFIIDFLGLTHA